jgi:hypothetical protein
MHLIPLGLQLNWAIILGSLLWTVTYLLIVRAGFKGRTYGIPMLALCLNITWEAIFAADCPMMPCPSGTCICPATNWMGKVIEYSWLGIDVLLLYTLLRWGRSKQAEPFARRYFYGIVAGMMVLAGAWHYGFLTFYGDIGGMEDAWVIDLIMGFLFVHMAVFRKDTEGLPLSAAWTKLGGNVFTALGMLMNDPFPFPGHDSYLFIYYLFAAVVALDVLYIWLLHHRKTDPNLTEEYAALA